MRIMTKAEALFGEFSLVIKAKRLPSKPEHEIDSKCEECARLFGLLDAVWSNVRGIEAGLLPTDDQMQQLRKATSDAKQLWLSLKLGALQPKWHLTFDGHLVDQVVRCGGLADKADDTIELQHQMLMKLRDRYRSITSCQCRETCIRRELKRRKSPETKLQIDKCEGMKCIKADSKRQLAANERQQDNREAKRVKREAMLQG